MNNAHLYKTRQQHKHKVPTRLFTQLDRIIDNKLDFFWLQAVEQNTIYINIQVIY